MIIIFSTLNYFYVKDTFERFTTLSENNLTATLQAFQYFIEFLANFLTDLANLLFQFVHFSFCLLTRSMFQQLQDDLDELVIVRDKKRLECKILNAIQFHNEILQTMSTFFRTFKLIVGFNLLTDIIFLGEPLIGFHNYDFFQFYVELPYVISDVFDAWIFCYPLQLIITKVNFSIVWKVIIFFYCSFKSQEITFSVYSLYWYRFDSNSSRTLFILMLMKFQKPIEFKVFRVFRVNLELLIFVSWKSVKRTTNFKLLFPDFEHIFHSFHIHGQS